MLFRYRQCKFSMYESVAKLPCGKVTVAKLPCGEVTGNRVLLGFNSLVITGNIFIIYLTILK